MMRTYFARVLTLTTAALLGLGLSFQDSWAKPPVDCSQIISELWAQGECKRGYCNDNVERLLSRPPRGLDLSRAKVLVIKRPGVFSEFAREPNLILLNEKERGTYPSTYHVALAQDGWVYDPSAGDAAAALPQAKYFESMLLWGKNGFNFRGPKIGEAQKRHLAYQAERHALTEREQLFSEVLITEIPAKVWKIENAQFHQNPGDEDGWFAIAEKYRTRTLGSYLADRSDKTFLVSKSRIVDRVYNTYTAGKASVSVCETGIEAGEVRHVPNAVRVLREGETYGSDFSRVPKPLSSFLDSLPTSFIDMTELQGKVVLDSTMGGGLFVEELREKGAIAFGIDLALTGYQKPRLLVDTREKRENDVILPKSIDSHPFIWGDAIESHLAESQVDVIYDLWGIYTAYFFKDGGKNVLEAYQDWKRILKVGGVIRFGSFDYTYSSDVATFFSKIPGLEFKVLSVGRHEPFVRFGELKKIR